jgi:molecular chaperone GrpE
VPFCLIRGIGKIIAPSNGNMFFNKKKVMTDKTTHSKKTARENADNMAQNEPMEEVLSNEQTLENNDNKENAAVEAEIEKVKKLEAELNEVKDKYLRLVAEFDNFRRRTAKERMELVQTAGKDIVQSLLVVLDDMDRASKQLENTNDLTLIKEGISLVFNKLKVIMLQKGLKIMEAQNQDFDPDLHEAITEVPAPSEEMKGKILDVVEPGYYLNDKLIRHAKVVVGS